MNRSTPFLASLLVGVAALLSACGGGAAPPEPTTHVVEIRGMGFQPAELRVAAGDTVVWVNRDLLAHTATDIAGGWSSPSLEMGDRWQWVAGNAGQVNYRCAFHPTMEASLVVAPGT